MNIGMETRMEMGSGMENKHEHEKVTCVLSEPQFNPDIVETIAKDTNISSGVLDPLGATLDSGKTLYFDLIKNISLSIKN